MQIHIKNFLQQLQLLLEFNAPLSTPPICDQPEPYRVATPGRIFPENIHTIFFEFCNNYNIYVNFEPELEIRSINIPNSNWTKIELVIVFSNVVSDTLEEWSYRGEYYFESCLAIEGRFRFLSLLTLDPQTNWRNIEIPRLWECGPPVSESIDLVGFGIIGIGIIFLIGGIYAVPSTRKYLESKPKIQRYNHFVKLRNFSKNQIQQNKNIEKKYRIIKSGSDSLELYRKDGRSISDQDFREILSFKQEIKNNLS
ncbi:MAG: hypothetical protein HeimC3_06360 [Candidatus Heimdallarchaeota archaeon LC_3]|nr:MAG: hypothetical protein HeimC3_06360 [Candidatus Heimdallarchaeota archaeon LC_3]